MGRPAADRILVFRSRLQAPDIPSAREDYTWMVELNQRPVNSSNIDWLWWASLGIADLTRQVPAAYFPDGWAGCSTC